MLQAAIDSCEMVCTLLHTREAIVNRDLMLHPRVRWFSTAKANIIGNGGTGARTWRGGMPLPLPWCHVCAAL